MPRRGRIDRPSREVVIITTITKCILVILFVLFVVFASYTFYWKFRKYYNKNTKEKTHAGNVANGRLCKTAEEASLYAKWVKCEEAEDDSMKNSLYQATCNIFDEVWDFLKPFLYYIKIGFYVALICLLGVGISYLKDQISGSKHGNGQPSIFFMPNKIGQKITQWKNKLNGREEEEGEYEDESDEEDDRRNTKRGRFQSWKKKIRYVNDDGESNPNFNDAPVYQED
ncbi:MAG: hypothetical protein ACTSUE_13860 [Promethearchaeota archaeon]